ncbi:MAG TPA: poly-gamma-glutamate system protein [Thermotogota bacterium]|jgi:poly-gamma-glutamate system protein|nr:poly-gamma-glutamate system protein [Thermotogota bacterium]OQC32376.1 MAG: hypothetical protein BWX67_00443 [Thermotogota bacterium ADurb.Bin062]HNW47097.1 poly-gamma-glutamate system protein [Thermotogota bacterium]HNY82096.1 poly-gamma-glutamate system protein [Thermotogota bacterium]HOD90402.1 poly-gamma-glutamate system protein [Thermotogota bacterium]
MKAKDIWLMLGLAVSFFFLFRFVWYRQENDDYAEMHRARQEMVQALQIVRGERLNRGIPIDLVTDPNQTGIIGYEYSEITSTPGELEAKRTTTNPDMAALMVSFFKELGLSRGDIVVVGSSGSFPSLYIACLSACEAMGLAPLSIISLMASEYGANIPGFNFLDMVTALKEAGKTAFYPGAVSIGGESDSGKGVSSDVIGKLETQIESSGLQYFRNPSLKEGTQERLDWLNELIGERPIKAFVNIGGATANVGTDPIFLYLKPGVNHISQYAPFETGGLLYALARQGIPVIHLLYVKGLVAQNGLPWDPIPLPSELSLQRKLLGVSEKAAMATLFLAYWAIALLLRLRGARTLRHRLGLFDRQR